MQCGVEADFDPIGLETGAAVGIYANLVEFVAIMDSTSTCEFQKYEWFDLNVGAFASAGVELDYKPISALPYCLNHSLQLPDIKAVQAWQLSVESGTGIAHITTEDYHGQW